MIEKEKQVRNAFFMFMIWVNSIEVHLTVLRCQIHLNNTTVKSTKWTFLCEQNFIKGVPSRALRIIIDHNNLKLLTNDDNWILKLIDSYCCEWIKWQWIFIDGNERCFIFEGESHERWHRTYRRSLPSEYGEKIYLKLYAALTTSLNV